MKILGHVFWFFAGVIVTLVAGIFVYSFFQQRNFNHADSANRWASVAANGALAEHIQQQFPEVEEDFQVLPGFVKALAIDASYFFEDGEISEEANQILTERIRLSVLLMNGFMKTNPELLEDPIDVPAGYWKYGREIPLFPHFHVSKKIKNAEDYRIFVRAFSTWLEERRAAVSRRDDEVEEQMEEQEENLTEE